VHRRLPAMAALRAFETAAQLGSFKQAAVRLHRTPSAVSHQIRRLEGDLGVSLFHREPNGLRLTEAGRGYLQDVHEALDRLDEATTRLRRQHGDGPLSVSLFPSFAVRWLIPRLNDFRALHPEVELALVNSLRQADFEHDDIDAAIRFGEGHWPSLRADPLMTEVRFPVCSPAVATGPPALTQPRDLRHAVLLHNAAHPDEWRIWLEEAGIEGVDPERGPVFDASNEVLAAAANGMGVALGRSPLIDDELVAGRLVEPFSIRIRTPGRYWLVAPEATAGQPGITALRAWLRAQIEAIPDVAEH